MMTSSVTCSGSAVASTTMALMPPVSAISGTIGPSFAASVWLMAWTVCVEPVNATPAIRGSSTSGAPMGRAAGNELQRLFRHARLVQKARRLKGDERRLRNGLGNHRIAGNQSCRDLTDEDRQREIPRRDAKADAAPTEAIAVLLARRPRHQLARTKEFTRLHRVVAAEIDCLADFRHSVGLRLARLNGQKRHDAVAVFLQQIRHPVERGSTPLHR